MLFDWTIQVTDIIVLLGAALTLLKTMRQQALRDQKIDLILFGSNGQPGLLGDVKHLKREMYEPVGAVARLRNSVTKIRIALAAKKIEVDE